MAMLLKQQGPLQETFAEHLKCSTIGRLQAAISSYLSGLYDNGVDVVPFSSLFKQYARKLVSVCGDQNLLIYGSKGSIIDVLDAFVSECFRMKEIFRCVTTFQKTCDKCMPLPRILNFS